MDIKDINIRNLQSEIDRCIVPDRTRVQGQGHSAAISIPIGIQCLDSGQDNEPAEEDKIRKR